MLIKVTQVQENNTITTSHRKEERGFKRSYVLAYIGKGEIQTAMRVRIYWTKTRCYCCVWVNSSMHDGAPKALHTAGSGFAGGYGYCKESAAIEKALEAAGFRFNGPFGGHGTGAAKDAMLAIGEWLGLDKPKIITENA